MTRALDEHERRMIDAARRRAIVRLVDGRLATLVSYGTREGRRRARFEGADGRTRWSGRTVDVIEVVVPDAAGDVDVDPRVEVE